MPIVREETAFRRSSVDMSADVDISQWDKVGRLTTDGKGTYCTLGENPMFVFAESGVTGSPASVIWRAKGGRMSLRLRNSGGKGNKLKASSDGTIIASGTSESAVPASGDFAIALEDWHDGESVEVEVLA